MSQEVYIYISCLTFKLPGLKQLMSCEKTKLLKEYCYHEAKFCSKIVNAVTLLTCSPND